MLKALKVLKVLRGVPKSLRKCNILRGNSSLGSPGENPQDSRNGVIGEGKRVTLSTLPSSLTLRFLYRKEVEVGLLNAGSASNLCEVRMSPQKKGLATRKKMMSEKGL